MKKLWIYFEDKMLNHARLSIAMSYVVANILIGIVYYFFDIIPLILNYPPGTFDTNFQIEYMNSTYTQQFIFMITLSLIIGFIWIYSTLKQFQGWKLLLKDNCKKNIELIRNIRIKCIKLPYFIYFMQILIPNIMVILGLLFFGLPKDVPFISIIRIWSIIFSFTTLAAVFTYIFSKRIFAHILTKTFKNEELEGTKVSLRVQIIGQLLPIIIVGIIFTSLIGYAKITKERGNLLFDFYTLQLSQIANANMNNINSIVEAKNTLAKIKLTSSNDSTFIVTPEGAIISSNDIPLSKFYQKYISELSNKYNGRVYDFYGVNTQGVILKNNTGWTLGIRYITDSPDLATFFISSVAILIFLNLLAVLYFSYTLSDSISSIANKLSKIAESNINDNNEKIEVTSNDEIGELVVSFNRIVDKQQNIRDILIQKDRLATLGNLIGSIAHNLKTPIMSISGSADFINKLVKEYDVSVSDKDVTIEDHHEIASEMAKWTCDIKELCSYMSDVISAVKGQATQLNNSGENKFSVNDVIKQVKLLARDEIKKRKCLFKVHIEIDPNTYISGQASNLVQVINNLVMNACDAYDDGGEIILSVVTENDRIVFRVQDFGKGIPEDVKNRLFNEMVTTKGSKGTGLGLYMSYSAIRGKFRGEMWFESTEGEGTIFYLSVSINS